MKKSLSILLAITVLFFLTSCSPKQQKSGKENSLTETSKKSTQQTVTTFNINSKVDVDLTKLSKTMVYSRVYNMVYSPEEFINKTVKMRGEFAVYNDGSSGKTYFTCIISDATACCSQGIEFVLAGNKKFPEDYPKPGTEITVIGTFGTYEEANGGKNYTYCQLTDANIVK